MIDQGSLVPCDCYIQDGSSNIDESSVTGEVIPVKKTTGDFILSGSRNISRPLVAVVYKGQYESSLMNLVDEISLATDQKMKGEDKINSMVSYFVKIVLLIALLIFVRSFVEVRTSLTGKVNVALDRAMTILAAACPCGLGLAIPSAMMAGIGKIPQLAKSDTC